MDEIVPQLWVGELESSFTRDYLAQARITKVISVMRSPPKPPSAIPADGCVRSFAPEDVMVVPIDDRDDAPIFLYFGLCNRFIEQQLREKWVCDEDGAVAKPDDEYAIEGLTQRRGCLGAWKSASDGSVLIHCQAGYSRSVTVCCARLRTLTTDRRCLSDVVAAADD